MLPQFMQIKRVLLAQIENGDMRPGDKVPSENQLAEAHNVSRMTARKAVSMLVHEGILLRSQGLGTFVSDHRPMSSMLTIKRIDQEVTERGNHYSNQIISLVTEYATEQEAIWLGVEPATTIFRSIIVHYENQQPLQVEDRLVNPALVPDYLNQDFSIITSSQYLNQIAPLTEADHIVEAILPAKQIAQYLDINDNQPCLKISRRTFSKKGIVSFAQLFHPGHRYRIGGHLDF